MTWKCQESYTRMNLTTLSILNFVMEDAISNASYWLRRNTSFWCENFFDQMSDWIRKIFPVSSLWLCVSTVRRRKVQSLPTQVTSKHEYKSRSVEKLLLRCLCVWRESSKSFQMRPLLVPDKGLQGLLWPFLWPLVLDLMQEIWRQEEDTMTSLRPWAAAVNHFLGFQLENFPDSPTQQ